MGSDESTLWARAHEGDGGAFAEIFELHRGRVYNHAWRLTATAHDAEDLTAMAFLELWRRQGAVRIVGGSVPPWLLVVTQPSSAIEGAVSTVAEAQPDLSSSIRGKNDRRHYEMS